MISIEYGPPAITSSSAKARRIVAVQKITCENGVLMRETDSLLLWWLVHSLLPPSFLDDAFLAPASAFCAAPGRLVCVHCVYYGRYQADAEFWIRASDEGAYSLSTSRPLPLSPTPSPRVRCPPSLYVPHLDILFASTAHMGDLQPDAGW
jgi:hypothetical protein